MTCALGLYARYSTGIRRMRYLQIPHRNQKTMATWIWGPSGAGKTTYALSLALKRPVYVKDGTDKWWPDYNGEEVVVIDDYAGAFPYAQLMRMIGNSYPWRGETKGGHVPFSAKEVIFTSIKHPAHVYKDIYWKRGLERRLEGRVLWMSDRRVYKTDFIPVARDQYGKHEEHFDVPPHSQRTEVL